MFSMKKNMQDVLEILEIYDEKGEVAEDYTVRKDKEEQEIRIYKNIPLEDENKIEGTDCILYFSGKIDKQTGMLYTTGGLSYITIQEVEEGKYKVIRGKEESIIDKTQQQIKVEDIKNWTKGTNLQVVKGVADEIIKEANREKSKANKVEMRA